jgi:hypothetical protein
MANPERDIPTRPYSRQQSSDDAKAAAKWIAGILGALTVAAILGAHGMIQNHEGRITRVETKTETVEEQYRRIESKLDRLIERSAP